MPILQEHELHRKVFDFLDIGSGPNLERARWLARRHPDSDILAIDVEKLAPGLARQLPSNVHFVQGYIPQTLDKLLPESVREIYADSLHANSHEMSADGIKRVLVPGGVLHVVNDGLNAHIVREFYGSKGFHVTKPTLISPTELDDHPSPLTRNLVNTAPIMKALHQSGYARDPTILGKVIAFRREFKRFYQTVMGGTLYAHAKAHFETTDKLFEKSAKSGEASWELIAGMLMHSFTATKERVFIPAPPKMGRS